MNQTKNVSEWIAHLRWEDIPAPIVVQAKRCLRDHLACVAGGAQSEPGRIASHVAATWGGEEEATVVGLPGRVAARHAAFANATLANALDFDDTQLGHPGATTFATALAAAEKWEATGRELLLAAIAGYELSFRTMALMRPLVPRYRAMWDLGTLQAFGAAATAARLASLDARGIANTIGLVSGTAPVPLPRKQRFDGEGRSMMKSAYGWAADAAIVAAELTRAGFTGPGHALDDNLGFWDATPSGTMADFTSGLGENWAILGVEFKPYMACRYIHPVLQAVETAMGRRDIRPSDVEGVDIDSYSLLADEHHYILRPVSHTDAQFSVPYTVAAMLDRGALTPASYERASLQDPRLLDLAARVRVVADPELEAAFPGRLGARVRIRLSGGSSETAVVDHPKGGVDDGLPSEALLGKFHDLADPLLGVERATHVATAIDDVDDAISIAPLMDAFRGPEFAVP